MNEKDQISKDNKPQNNPPEDALSQEIVKTRHSRPWRVIGLCALAVLLGALLAVPMFIPLESEIMKVAQSYSYIRPFALLLLVAMTLVAVLTSSAQPVVKDKEVASDSSEDDKKADFLADALESVTEGYARFDTREELVFFNTPFINLFPDLIDDLNEGAAFGSLMRKARRKKSFLNVEEYDVFDEVMEGWQKANAEPIAMPMADGRWLTITISERVDGTRIILVSDVTELKDREMALIEAQKDLENKASEMWNLAVKAQQASRAKSDFLAVISHEIRTPMNAIVGMSDLISDTKLDKIQKKYAAGIGESADHLLTLINDILDFARLDSSHYKLDEAPFDLPQMIDSTVEMARNLPRAKGVEIVSSLPKNLPKAVVGDFSRVSQVLLNLLSNASKFTEEGTIEVGVEMIERVKGRVHMRFFVADTGPGIPEVLRNSLFEPFEKDRTWAVPHREGLSNNGTGLGLAICRKLVELMEGSIDFDHSRTQGTKVSFELVFDETSAKKIAPLKSEKPDFSEDMPSLRILVAEDTPASQLVIKTMLEKLGHEVQTAINGQEAVEAMDEAVFDVVLMDLEMPVMNGIEATEAIREIKGAVGETPIIALTAQALESRRKVALQAGMNDYLIKPLRMSDLKKVLSGVASDVAVADAERALENAKHKKKQAVEPKKKKVTVFEPEHFDAVLLADMAEALGYDDFMMLFEKFQKNAVEQLEKLDGAILDKDEEQIVAVAHRLVGLFSQFGVQQVAELAVQAETAKGAAKRIKIARSLQEGGVASLLHVENMLDENVFFPDRKTG